MSQRVINCPKYLAGDNNAKHENLLQTKKRNGFLCKYCSSFSHKSESCCTRNSVKCKQCKESHIGKLHDFQSKLSCSVSSIVATARISLQDIEITEGAKQ